MQRSIDNMQCLLIAFGPCRLFRKKKKKRVASIVNHSKYDCLSGCLILNHNQNPLENSIQVGSHPSKMLRIPARRARISSHRPRASRARCLHNLCRLKHPKLPESVTSSLCMESCSKTTFLGIRINFGNIFGHVLGNCHPWLPELHPRVEQHR